MVKCQSILCHYCLTCSVSGEWHMLQLGFSLIRWSWCFYMVSHNCVFFPLHRQSSIMCSWLICSLLLQFNCKVPWNEIFSIVKVLWGFPKVQKCGAIVLWISVCIGES